MKYFFTLLIFIISIYLSGQDYIINTETLSNGFREASNATHKVSGTLGQSIIGVSTNQSNKVESGFWYCAGGSLGKVQGMISLTTTTLPRGDIESIVVMIGDYSVNPDSTGFYSVSVPAGTYSISASLTEYTQVEIESVDVFPSQISDIDDITLIDWLPDSYSYQMTVFAEILIDGETFVNDFNNVTSVFSSDNEYDCLVLGDWLEGPDVWQFTVESNDNSGNEEIFFYLYYHSTQKILECNESFIFVNSQFHGNPFNPITLHTRLPTAKNVQIVTDNDYANISWSCFDGLFHIYRSTSPNNDFLEIGFTNDKTFIDNDTNQNGKLFYYITRE